MAYQVNYSFLGRWDRIMNNESFLNGDISGFTQKCFSETNTSSSISTRHSLEGPKIADSFSGWLEWRSRNGFPLKLLMSFAPLRNQTGTKCDELSRHPVCILHAEGSTASPSPTRLHHRFSARARRGGGLDIPRLSFFSGREPGRPCATPARPAQWDGPLLHDDGYVISHPPGRGREKLRNNT